MMPPLPMRVTPTSMVGSTTVAPLSCACAAGAPRPSASAAPIKRNMSPHVATFLRSRATHSMRRAQRVRPDPMRRKRNATDQARDAVVSKSFGGITSPAARPSHRHCRHRCERPLRMDAPSTGWVTALAGLLARGSSLSCVRPSRLPSGRKGRELSAHSCGGSHGFELAPCSLFRPRSPGEPARRKCGVEA